MSDNLTQYNHVNITGLTRVTIQRQNKGGSTILAYFDAEARVFGLKGCAFVRTSNGGLTVFTPKIDSDTTDRRGVKLLDDQLRSCFIRAAQDAYRAMGGTDGEWLHDREAPIEHDGLSRLLTRAG
jgi:hypothetical protein